MQVLPPWLPLPRSLKQGYRYWTLDARLPQVGLPLLVQCALGTRYAHAEVLPHPDTGKPVVQFVSDDTKFHLMDVWCFYVLEAELHQPSKTFAVSYPCN